MARHLTSCLALFSLLLAAPTLSVAEAKEPLARDVSEFNRNFQNMQSDIDSQIQRNGKVFPETIERTRKNVDTVIGYIERSGADPAPFRKQVEDYLANVNARANAASRSQDEAKVSTSIPKVPAQPGIEVVPAGDPTWCDPIDAQYQGSNRTQRDIRMPENPEHLQMSGVRRALLFSCALPDFAPTQAWIQAYRQQVSNMQGFTVAENEAFMKRAAGLVEKSRTPRTSEEATARCAPLPGKTEGLIEQRIERDLVRGVLGCAPASGRIEMQFTNSIPLWLVDLPAGPETAIGKLGLATTLNFNNVPQWSSLFDPANAPDKSVLIENRGLAQIVEFDEAAVWAQVDSLGYDAETRFNVDAYIRGEFRVLESVRRFAEDAAATNPNLKDVYLDGPLQGLASYREQQAASAKVMDLLLAVEDRIGPEPGGSDGCAEQFYEELRPWLVAKVAADKPSQPKDLAFDDLRGSLLYRGLITCGTHDTKAPLMARVIEELYAPATNLQRGPISAAWQGMLDAYNENRANPQDKPGGFSSARGQKSTVVEVANLHRNPVMAPTLGRMVGPYPHGLVKRAVIASITPADGGFSKISFRTESVQSPIRDCKETGRYARIDDNGRLVPEYDCHTTGWETLKVTEEPVHLPTWLASAHQPGQLLVFRGSRADERKQVPSYGWPMAAYSNSRGTTLVSMLGVPLK